MSDVVKDSFFDVDESVLRKIDFLDNHLRKSQIVFLSQCSDGSFRKVFGRIKGNLVYAYGQNVRIDSIQRFLSESLHCHFDDGVLYSNMMFLTLTCRYDYTTERGVEDSWLIGCGAWQRFIRIVKRRYNVSSYVFTREAHLNGGLHYHIALVSDGLYRFDLHESSDGKYYINRGIQDDLRSVWSECLSKYKFYDRVGEGKVFLDSDVKRSDLHGVESISGLSDYIMKELGKYSEFESVLRFYRKTGKLYNWQVNKLNTFYYSIKLGFRLFGYSRGMVSKDVEEIDDTSLVNTIMNKSTDFGDDMENFDVLSDDKVEAGGGGSVRFFSLSKSRILKVPEIAHNESSVNQSGLKKIRKAHLHRGYSELFVLLSMRVA